jgi:hypothetical protein
MLNRDQALRLLKLHPDPDIVARLHAIIHNFTPGDPVRVKVGELQAEGIIKAAAGPYLPGLFTVELSFGETRTFRWDHLEHIALFA